MVSAKHASSNWPQGVSPSYGNGFRQGKRKALIGVGIKPTTSAWNQNCSTDGVTKETGTGCVYWDSYSSLIDYSIDFQGYAVNFEPFDCSYVINGDHFGFFFGGGGGVRVRNRVRLDGLLAKKRWYSWKKGTCSAIIASWKIFLRFWSEQITADVDCVHMLIYI